MNMVTCNRKDMSERILSAAKFIKNEKVKEQMVNASLLKKQSLILRSMSEIIHEYVTGNDFIAQSILED